MRQFSLKNKSGEVYRLNSIDYFFHEPEGLGFTRNATYKKIGNHYEMIQDGFEQTPVTGRIMFKSDPTQSAYRRYMKFKNFLQEIPLTFVYRIPGGEFMMDCVPGSVEKTEINSAFGMDVGITLTPLSMWYKSLTDSASGTSITVESDSVIESPCHVIFTPGSSITSLSWTQTVNGASVVTGALSGMSSSAAAVHIRTDTDPYKIYRGTSTDVYSKSNFATKRFMLLQKGTNVITFNISGTISIEGRILYETV